jgi:hypothetical protein
MAHNIRDVMAKAHLSSTARLTYLWVYWTARGGVSYATSADLCQRIGVGDEAISKAARELEAANLVRRERAGARGKGNKRWVLIPALLGAFAFATPAESSRCQASNQAFPFSYQDSEAGRRRKKKTRRPQAAHAA